MSENVLVQINEVVDKYIRPALQADGGDIEIVDFRGNVLSVRLQGACSCCPHARMTLENAVGNTIRQVVSRDIIIKAL
ncbi:MAG: NifU family protein [Alphaproteobacteria bacterium]|nr:NifU family protein [Alphaproteobacteria bacterium]